MFFDRDAGGGLAVVTTSTLPLDDSSPGSPPGMTSSKTSKSSSFRSSFHSDDAGVLADESHFEDIGLDDDNAAAVHYDSHHLRDLQVKAAPPNPYSPSFSSDLRAASLLVKQNAAAHASSKPLSSQASQIALAKQRPIPSLPREVSNPPTTQSQSTNTRPPFPSLQNHVRSVNVRSTSLQALSAEPFAKNSNARPSPFRATGAPGGVLTSRSTNSLPLPVRRQRSSSPHHQLSSLVPRDPNTMLVKPRRSSWQANKGRKSAVELEKECDEDDGDDIPDGLILDNVPISPRPPQERSSSSASTSPPSSKSTSPERLPVPSKERVRSVGNGTPPVALAQGSLRSPSWKSDSALAVGSGLRATASVPQSPIKARARSWNAALADLSAEAKALTEKLEEHADEVETKNRRPGQVGRPNTWDSPRRRSADAAGSMSASSTTSLPELPPLRRTNIMIDPLPISKEKEAVLSRTRPSWLPPKDPAEERRHLREYQKMMAQSAESDKRRDAARRAKSACRDSTADGLMHLWEDDILPRWSSGSTRERRTREIWWRQGVAPRCRPVVWARAIGNELGLSEASYNAALGRAREVEARVAESKGDADDVRRAAWFASIRKEVDEGTWTDLRIFQAGAPLHQGLVDVLSAYAMYRSDIGYVSGCNTIAALLLLNLPSPAATFIALANMLNRPLPLSFYAADPGAKASAYNLVMQTLSQKSSHLYDHLIQALPKNTGAEANPEFYLCELFTALFTGSSLAIDEVSRLWDVYVFEGDAVLVRAAVALLLEREMSLLGCQSAAEVKAVLMTGTTTSKDAEEKSSKRLFSETGAEDRWMQAVRDAGRC